MNKEIYLDNAATTKPYDEVVETICEALKFNYGNPSSLHNKGVLAEKAIKNSRKIIADSLSVSLNEIIFTSGGTEANNLAIIGTINANKKNGNHIITSKIEHASVLNTFKHLQEQGFDVSYIDVDKKGVIDTEQLKKEIRQDTILVSIMHINNETGVIQPINLVGEIIKQSKSNSLFHVDAVQSYGKTKFFPKECGIDLLSISSHKIHGPKGVGGIYIRKGVKVLPNSFGGSHEGGIRSGTENLPGITGFAKAVEISFENLDKVVPVIKDLKNRLMEKIQSDIDEVVINSGLGDLGAPHILNVSFRGVKSEVVLHSLESEGIYVSSGSACSSKKTSPSHVLTAMGVERDIIEGAVRFSLSSFNSRQDIDICVEKLDTIIKKLRKFKRR